MLSGASYEEVKMSNKVYKLHKNQKISRYCLTDLHKSGNVKT